MKKFPLYLIVAVALVGIANVPSAHAAAGIGLFTTSPSPSVPDNNPYSIVNIPYGGTVTVQWLFGDIDPAAQCTVDEQEGSANAIIVPGTGMAGGTGNWTTPALTATTTFTMHFCAGTIVDEDGYGIQVNVGPAPVSVSSVTVTPATASTQVGGTQQFTATVNGTGAFSSAVTWSSSNIAIATVDSTGKVTAKAVGSATITATSVQDATKSGTATITVTAVPCTVSSVTVTPATVSLSTGATQQFTGIPATAGSGCNTSVTWSVTGGGTISASGLYTAPATAATATIKATSVQDATKSETATATVTVPAVPTGTITVTSENSVNLKPVYSNWTFPLFVSVDPCTVGSCAGTFQQYPSMPIGPYGIQPGNAPTLYTLRSVSKEYVAEQDGGILTNLFALVKSALLRIAEAVGFPVANPQDQTLISSGTANFIILWDPTAQMTVTPASSLPLAVQQGSTASGQVTIANSGTSGSTLNWSTVSSQPWLTVSQASGCLDAGGTANNTCSDTSGAQTITVNANATSLSVGTYTGTITFSGTTAPRPVPPGIPSVTITVTLTVSAAPIPSTITSVTVTPAPVSVQVGSTQQLTATVAGTGSYNNGVTWSSSNASVATVSNTGNVTAVAAGSVTITATSAQDGSKSSSSVVTVTAAPVPSTITSVSVSPSPASVQTGGTQQFTATVSGTGSYSSGVTWSVSGGGTISATGLYTAPAGATTATITAVSSQDATKSGTATANVTASAVPSTITSITVMPVSGSVQTGGTQQFTATVSGTGSYSSGVTWSVSGGGTISATGLYTAPAGATTVTITATSVQDPTKSGTATITVTASPAPPSGGTPTITINSPQPIAAGVPAPVVCSGGAGGPYTLTTALALAPIKNGFAQSTPDGFWALLTKTFSPLFTPFLPANAAMNGAIN